MSKHIPDNEKAYWAKRAQDLPHYEPVHQTQPQQQQRHAPAPQQNGGYGDMDLTAALAQRAMQAQQQQVSAPQYRGTPPTQHQQQQAPQRTAYIRENSQTYRVVDHQAFGTTKTLAMHVGPLNNDLVGREFEIKGVVECLVVEGNQPIDLGKMSENPGKLVRLMKLSAPFIGDILVPESAIVRSQQNSGTQLLRG